MRTIRFLLFPLTVFYYLITTFRNYLFDVGLLKSTFFETPVIVVGNLSMGGTGKSPQIEYLIRILQNKKKVAVLSRGYKRKSTGYLVLNNTHSALDVGDEPLQFFKKFPSIIVAVDSNRVRGIQQLRKTLKPGIILLDDAFQHRSVNAGLSILLTSYNDFYYNDFVLPTGNLREHQIGARRANIIIVSKCPNDLSEQEQLKIRDKLKVTKKQVVFFSKISYNSKTLGALNVELEELNEYEIILVTGIAKPMPLLEFLEKKKCKVHHLKFSDHHHFSNQEIKRIQSEFDQLTSTKKLLLTTEKDYRRLSSQISGLTYLEIKTEFLKNQQKFDCIIQSFCEIEVDDFVNRKK